MTGRGPGTTLAEAMVSVAYGDVMHTHPYERSLVEIYAEEVRGHRCVVRVSTGHVAMLGYEIANGRIVGTIATRPIIGGDPAQRSRRDVVADLLDRADREEARGAADRYDLGDVIRSHFLIDGAPGSMPDVPRPSRSSLDRHLPCWRALEDVASRLDGTVVDLPLPYTATVREYAWLARVDALRAARHDLMRRFWFAGDEILGIRAEVDLGLAAGMPGEEIVLTALCERHAGFRARAAGTRSRRRMLAVLAAIAGYPSEERYLCFRALRVFVDDRMPWDRLPHDCEGWIGLAGLQVFAEALVPADDARRARMLDVPGGRYRELWDRLVASPLGIGVREAIMQSVWTRDRPEAEVEGLVRVNLPHDAAGEVNRVVARCADFLVQPLSRVRNLGIGTRAAPGVAAELILRDRSVMAIAEAWTDWMRLQPAMSEALAQLAVGDDMRWPAPTLRNPLRRRDMELRWLTTPGELIDEGSRWADYAGMGGLDHCVATYMDDTLSGRSHILSIRGLDANGRMERLSTVEFVSNRDETGFKDQGEPEFTIVQHRGPGNGEPPARALAAARDMLRDLNAGRIRLRPLGAPSGPPRGGAVDPETAMARLVRDEVGVEAMLRVFDPLFARGLRGLAVDAFAAALVEGRRR